jgi:hypothetical protein
LLRFGENSDADFAVLFRSCECCSGPTTVLAMSLIFIASVVVLHVLGKFQK